MVKSRLLALIFSVFTSSILITAACAPNAFSGTINYGDLDDIAGGGTVYFNDVRESSGTDPVPLYGTPTVTINLLEFPTGGFVANASNGSVDITDGELDFTAEALENVGIVSLTVSEFGDYTLAGSGTALTRVLVGSIGFATITEVDGTPISPFTVNASMSQQYDLVNNGGIVLPWISGISIDFNQALNDKGIDYTLGVTEFDYVMNNQMLAFSEAGTIAYIAKKDFDIDIATIPIPTTVWFFGSGIIFLLGIRRKIKT